MHNREWKREVFTVPNMLSIFRLLLIPLYCGIYLKASGWQDYALSGGILALSCATDCLDGMIARKTNSVTTVGKILDPLSDKATQLAVTVCLVRAHSALKWLVLLFILKEGLQALLGLYFLSCGKMLSGAEPAGKVSTAVYFASLVVLVLFPGLPAELVTGIAVMDCVFLLLSLRSYFQAYFGKDTKLHRFRE